MNMPIAAPLESLLELLSSKYFYSLDFFHERVRLLSLATTGKLDAVAFESFPGAPFAIFCAPGHAALSDAFRNLSEYASNTETVGVIGLLDKRQEKLNVWRRRFRGNEFDAISDLEYYCAPAERTGRTTSKAAPISHELENILFEIHSLMRDIDGLHADTALEEVCKLIYLKLFAEEHPKLVPTAPIESNHFGSIEEFSSCLRGIYRRSVEYDLRVFGLKIPEYERSRGVFDHPILLSSAALTKSFQLIERLSLSKTKTDIKGRAFQKVLSKSIRSGMGQYFTPAQVCELIVEVVRPTSSDLILDPFCGSGHFLSKSLDYVRRTVSSSSKEFHEFAFGKLHGIEKSGRMTRIAMTDMRLNGDGHSNIRCTDALLDFRNYPDLRAESFDLVLTNPPFGSLLGQEAFASLGDFSLANGRRRLPLELAGLERSIEFLRPGGRLAIVLPESFFSAESTKYARDWLTSKVLPRIVIDLPNETFAPFGANVRSGILFARKKFPGEKEAKTNICVIQMENLGYDASGRPTPNSDLKETAKTCLEFLDREGW